MLRKPNTVRWGNKLVTVIAFAPANKTTNLKVMCKPLDTFDNENNTIP